MSVLNGSTKFYEYDLTDCLEETLIRRLSYGLAEIEAFTVIDSSHSRYKLTRATNNSIPNNIAYEGLGQKWLWETDAHPNILKATTVLVDGVSTPANIDFANGQVFFDTDPGSGAVVQAEYTIPDIGVYPKKSNGYKKIVSTYLDELNKTDSDEEKGIAQILKSKRVWLPAVFVEATVRDYSPYEMGGTNYAEMFVTYNVFSDTAFACKKLTDILCRDYNTLIQVIDFNDPAVNHQYNPDGTLNNSAQQYEDLLSYDLTRGYVENVGTTTKEMMPGLWSAEIRQDIKVFAPI